MEKNRITGKADDRWKKMEGYLHKQSKWLKTWNMRYFRLKGRTLCYYDNEQSAVHRGSISLQGGKVAASDMRPYGILVENAKREEVYLCADSEPMRQEWVKAISNAMSKAPARRRLLQTTLQDDQGGEIEDETTEAQRNGLDDLSLLENGLSARDGQGSKPNSTSKVFLNEKRKTKPPRAPPPPPPDATDPLSYLITTQPTCDNDDKEQEKVDKSCTEKTLKGATGKLRSESEMTISPKQPIGSKSGFQTFEQQSREKDEYTQISGDSLRDAIKANNVAAVRKILEAKPELSHYTDQQLQTVLHIAVIFNNKEIVQELLKHGAECDVKNKQGETALDLASPIIATLITNSIQSSSATAFKN